MYTYDFDKGNGRMKECQSSKKVIVIIVFSYHLEASWSGYGKIE